MPSYWSQTFSLRPRPKLDRDLKTDVLVVGGGLCGVLCARKLTDAGVDCALVEADVLGAGTTGGTTAKVTAQHGLIYQKLIKEFGADAARLYYQANAAALEEYRSLCAGVDCDWTDTDSYIYAREDPRPLEKELKALETIGAPADFVGKLPLPFPTVGAVRFPRQAMVHPLKLLAALAEGLQIYEHTRVWEFTPGGIHAGGHTITADQVIVCTHFPLLNKHGAYFVKLCQDRSYALALAGGPPLEGMYLDQAKGGLSLRRAGEALILVGGGGRTGKPGEGWAPLSSMANRYFPGQKELCRWAAQDCMTLDGIPYIGPYSPRTPGLWVAAGFNKWGFTSSLVAANLLTGAITGHEVPWAGVFSPRRSVLRPQLAVNLWDSVTGLLSLRKPRCPHLGCALRWNRQERSWDCPCHGSRFGEDGSLLDNPATDGLK